MPIRCTIDGREISLRSFGVVPMNFGQERLWADRPHYRYTLHVPIVDICRAMSADYADYQTDTKQHPDDSDPLERALGSLNWPTLEKLSVGAPSTFLDLVVLFNYHVLLAVESWHYSSRSDYTLVSVDNVSSHHEYVEFKGVALGVQSPQAK